MEELVLFQEEENKRRGIVFSVILHLIILMLCLLPFMTPQDPPPEQQGVLVSFGMPDDLGTTSNEVSLKKSEVEQIKPTSSAKPTKVVKKESPQKQDPVKTTTLDQEDISVKTTSDDKANKIDLSEDIAIKKDQESREEQERIESEQREREAKEKEFNEKKNKYDDLINKGKNKGSSTKPKGEPKGDPNSDALEGIIDGSGKIGGGLGNRGILFEPTLQDKSQKQGIVVVRICVDPSGSVTEARFQQKGSKTTDQYLVDLAIKHAKKYKFSPGELEKQCGTVTLDFKLR